MFFCKQITKEKSYIFESEILRTCNINTISLQNIKDPTKKISVYFHDTKNKYKLCTISKNHDVQNVNLIFTLKNNIQKYKISITSTDDNPKINVFGFEIYDVKKYNKLKKQENKEGNNINIEKNNELKLDENDSDSDKIDDKNTKSVSIQDLFNKQSKETPQNMKPIVLNNLNKMYKKNNNLLKKKKNK